MVPDLIFDLGLHRGGDAAFYLEKGYRVVGVEANPRLCDRVRAELGRWIATGRLFIMPFAIAQTFGVRQFYINNFQDDWSSLVESFGVRGDNFEVIDVPCLPLTALFGIFGIPYYLKIDIEGLDDACIDQLAGLPELPRYISVEATVENFVSRMSALGYRSFKLVGQRRASLHRIEGSPLEGGFATPADVSMTSGHFGEETYGRWMTGEALEREFEHLVARRYDEMIHVREYGFTPEQLADEWFDMHARYGF